MTSTSSKKALSPATTGNSITDIRLLFLDVDGVLNYSDMGYTKPLPLSDEHVSKIGHIVRKTNCKIALSTSWRLRKKGKKKLKQALTEVANIDCKQVIIGCTPPPNILNQSLMKRAYEIRDFLVSVKNKQKYNVVQWCAVDDLDLADENKECAQIMDGHLCVTNPQTGISDENVQQIIDILNQ